MFSSMVAFTDVGLIEGECIALTKQLQMIREFEQRPISFSRRTGVVW